jgi:hypothetical protein
MCFTPRCRILIAVVNDTVQLPGWSERSLWGVSPTLGFIAQLTRDESAADVPDVWIVPPRRSRMETREQLAEAIAVEAGVTIAEALSALG